MCMSLRGGVCVHVSDMYKVVGEEGQKCEVRPLEVHLQPAAAWARSPAPHTHARTHAHTPASFTQRLGDNGSRPLPV